MGTRIETEVARLRAAASDGSLATLCRRFGIDVLVLFGSAVASFDAADLFDAAESATGGVRSGIHAVPHDIDVAARVERCAPRPNPIAVLQALYDLTGSETIDLMILNAAGPVAKQRALTRGRKLFEARPGLFATAQIAAIMEYFDTEPLRALGRSLLASA